MLQPCCGGKRLRPTLTLATADAIDGSVARKMRVPGTRRGWRFPPRAPVELIHAVLPHSTTCRPWTTACAADVRLYVVYDGIAVLAGDGRRPEPALLAREPTGEEPDLVARKLRVIRVIADAAGPARNGGQPDHRSSGRQPGCEGGALDADGLRTMHAGDGRHDSGHQR